MFDDAVFLHVTDAHLDGGIKALKRDDHKEKIEGIVHPKRHELLDQTFARVSEVLRSRGTRLSGVIFSGDATDRSKLAGHTHLYELIIGHFGEFGISAAEIVAVPGNHDVLKGSRPGSPERYKDFIDVWRTAGCVTPWLDDIDSSSAPVAKHLFAAPSHEWLVLPINSSNWSQIKLGLDDSVAPSWDKLHEVRGLKPAERDTLREALDDMIYADMARVSEDQLENARKLLAMAPSSQGRQLRIAVLHHHLHSPGLREEVKAFADLTNLSLFRTFVRQQRIDVVIHGHKHDSVVSYDYIDDGAGDDLHRALVISGGSLIGEGNGASPVRLLTFSGMPFVPEVTVEEFGLPRGGVATEIKAAKTRRIWRQDETLSGGPIVLQGTDIDILYERAVKVVGEGLEGSALVVHLDAEDADPSVLPLPKAYEVPGISGDAGRQKWLGDLVRWWQEPSSKLAARLPQAHGARMRRFGGKLDQVERISRLLMTETTTRAIAVLLDPFVDFETGSNKEEFASFCLVQFTRREPKANGIGPTKARLDCIAYYRAQEFRQWWPINIAELRLVQRQISAQIGALPGRITTIAADARYITTAPTQAIVPIIDRWSDHAPETVHILANALVSDAAYSARQEEIIQEWLLSLRNQILATFEYNPDGMPVALEGLETLQSYIDASEPETKRGGELSELLSRQISQNKFWTRSKRKKEDFDIWAPQTRTNLEKLLALSSRTQEG